MMLNMLHRFLPSKSAKTHADYEGHAATIAIQLLEKTGTRQREVSTGPKGQQRGSGTALSDAHGSKLMLEGVHSSDEIEVYSHGKAFLDTMFQAAVRDAMQCITQNFEAKVFDKRILVELDETVGIRYGGDSGGAALAIAGLSRERNIEPSPDVCMTGAIRPFGDVRPIGGLAAKTQGAANEGFRILLAPTLNGADLVLLVNPNVETLQIVTGSNLKDYLPFALPGVSDQAPKAAKALRAYAIAYHLYKAERLNASRAALGQLLEVFPNHFSAARLDSDLALAGVPRGKIAPDLDALLNVPGTDEAQKLVK